MKTFQKLSTEKYWQAALAQEIEQHEARKRTEFRVNTVVILSVVAITSFAAWKMPAWVDLAMDYFDSSGFSV